MNFRFTPMVWRLRRTGGPYGAALSLYNNAVAKPGARAIVRLEYFLRSYIPELIIRSNNGMY